MSNRELSRYEQESHMRILEQNMGDGKFEGIFEGGVFQEPAIVIGFDEMPNKNHLNMMVNSLNIESVENFNNNKAYLYIKNSGGEGLMLGVIDKSLDNIYLIEELLRRFEIKLVEVDNGQIKEINFLDYIEKMIL